MPGCTGSQTRLSQVRKQKQSKASPRGVGALQADGVIDSVKAAVYEGYVKLVTATFRKDR